MKYSVKLKLVKHYTTENFVDVVDVVQWLGLTIEDIIQAFPDALVDKYEEIKDEVEALSEDFGSGDTWEGEEENDY
jgi:hypothetical protein